MNILDMIDLIEAMPPGEVMHVGVNEDGEVMTVNGQEIPDETSAQA